MSFRTEEKIVLSQSDHSSLLAQLIERGMQPLYDGRKIHSVYLETPELAMFRDSEEGVLPRRKVRLRRYDQQDFLQSQLETKISSVEGRFKTTERMDKKQLLEITNFGLLDRQYGPIYPMIEVSYDRRYYSFDGLRITFDTGISYSRSDGSFRVDEDWTVCEIKAPFETPLDNLVKAIDVPRRRFSKFCQGIDMVIRTPGSFFDRKNIVAY